MTDITPSERIVARHEFKDSSVEVVERISDSGTTGYVVRDSADGMVLSGPKPLIAAPSLEEVLALLVVEGEVAMPAAVVSALTIALGRGHEPGAFEESMRAGVVDAWCERCGMDISVQLASGIASGSAVEFRCV
jgi:hypothetical protein